MDRKAFASALSGGDGAPAGGAMPLDGALASRSNGLLDGAVLGRAFAGATFGMPEGYTTRDSGTGLHEILDASGNVVGTGYDDTDTTLKEWQKQNIFGSLKQTNEETKDDSGKVTGTNSYWSSPYLTEQKGRLDENGNPVYADYSDMGPGAQVTDSVNRQFKTQEEAQAELQKVLDGSSSVDRVYGVRDYSDQFPLWFADGNRAEAIGILANQKGDEVYKGAYGTGTFNPGASNQRAEAEGFVGLPNTIRGNSISSSEVENVSGQHAMYGSQPVFKDGRLIGYKVDTRLMSEEAQQKMNDHYTKIGNPSRNQHSVGDFGVAAAWNRRSSATQNTMYRELNEGWDKFNKIGENEYFIPIGQVDQVPGWKNYAKDSYENWAGGGGFFGGIAAAVILGALTFGVGSLIGTALSATTLGSTAIAGTTLGSIAGHAIAGGLSAAVTGGDVGKGVLTGGLGGALGGVSAFGEGAGSLANFGSAAANQAGNMALRGIASGGVSAALRGSDVGAGMLQGGLTQGIGGFVGQTIGENYGQFAGQTAGKLASMGTGLLTSSMGHGDSGGQQQRAPSQTQGAATGYANIPQTDVSNMTTRQRIAASMRSY